MATYTLVGDELVAKLCVCGCLGELVGKQSKYASAKCAKRVARAQWIMKVYGITMEEYHQIYEFQDGRCPICERGLLDESDISNGTGGVKPHIDHEHGGHVRGLVCAYCNTRLIGRLKDHGKAQRLADYLRDPPAVLALQRRVIAPGRPKKKRQPRKRARK